jgi:hypothetical protein
VTKVFFYLTLLCFLIPQPAHAIKTASSFDLSWAAALLTLNASQLSATTATAPAPRRLTSYTGVQLDYNVAMFDYRTVATFSFTQWQTSNLGTSPMSRIAFGASYHLFRINGQRLILDNQVEGKVWGVSPALELSIGLNRLSVNDGNSFNFTAGIIDAIPRLLIEIPVSSTFLIMLRAGTYLTLQGSNALYKISLSGTVLNVGFKLTTL